MLIVYVSVSESPTCGGRNYKGFYRITNETEVEESVLYKRAGVKNLETEMKNIQITIGRSNINCVTKIGKFSEIILD